MEALLQFADFLVLALLNVMIWIVIIYVILSWLISFEVINMRNRVVYQIAHALDAVVTPMLRPLRRILPPLGGLDFAPFLFVIVLSGINSILRPALFAWLASLVVGAPPA